MGANLAIDVGADPYLTRTGSIRGERDAMLGQICAKLDAAPVQHIGKLLILWRRMDRLQIPDV